MRQCSRKRTGSAAAMLVLVLALLVGTFSISVSRRAAQDRRYEVHREKIALLQSAIDAIAQVDFKEGETVRLPLDDDSRRWITVESMVQSDDEKTYRASFAGRSGTGLTVTRRVENPS